MSVSRSIESNQQDETKNGSQQNAVQLTDLPHEILLMINDGLSFKDTARLASVNHNFHGLFQPEIGKKEAKDVAECVILPTEENVKKLKTSLKACPPRLSHPVIVKNRHGMPIKGTLYQIALHEGDNELIDDEIKAAFSKLNNGEAIMEKQRKDWFPDSWMEAEERACASACAAIDNVLAAFKNATNPNDVTESPSYPYTITINNEDVNKALEAFRKAIAALYESTDEVIENGRDPSIRLLERVIDRYMENYNALGGYDTPRNNAIMRSVYGYCQRFAPINFMQAFAQGIYYIVEEKQKLIRSFEYSNWAGHSILPLDSDLRFRLGYEHFAGRGWRRMAWWGGDAVRVYKTFCQSKTAAALQPCVIHQSIQNTEPRESVGQASSRKKSCAIM